MEQIFPELDNNVLHLAVGENHLFQLGKLVCKTYVKIRFYHLGRQKTAEVRGVPIRKNFSKLIHFKHQSFFHVFVVEFLKF